MVGLLRRHLSRLRARKPADWGQITRPRISGGKLAILSKAPEESQVQNRSNFASSALGALLLAAQFEGAAAEPSLEFLLRLAAGEAVRLGLATEYSADVVGRKIDVTVGSFEPHDARHTADQICRVVINSIVEDISASEGLTTRDLYSFSTWQVRAFLLIGDRPAASCLVP